MANLSNFHSSLSGANTTERTHTDGSVRGTVRVSLAAGVPPRSPKTVLLHVAFGTAFGSTPQVWLGQSSPALPFPGFQVANVSTTGFDLLIPAEVTMPHSNELTVAGGQMQPSTTYLVPWLAQ